MPTALKRKTSLSLDSAVLDEAKLLGINVSSVAEAALEKAVADARRAAWLAENAEAFAAQAEWHGNGTNGTATPSRRSWSDLRRHRGRIEPLRCRRLRRNFRRHRGKCAASA